MVRKGFAFDRRMTRREFVRLGAAGAVGMGFFGAMGCGSGDGQQAEGSLEGADLNIASMSDPFASILERLAVRFGEETGADVRVNVLGYPNLYSRVTTDFVGGTANYDLITTDILWSGEFAEGEFTVDLTDRIERDAGELDLDDIPEVVWKLGEWNGKQSAFPLAGYAKLLNYRIDVLRNAGIQPPATIEEVAEFAERVNNPGENLYGIAMNGQQGPPVAQQWMTYNTQLGGAILSGGGEPTLNSPANIASLEFYGDLFNCCTPPGALEFDWPARNTAFMNGLAVFLEGWSVSRQLYEDPEQSKVAGDVGDAVAPSTDGLFGGWGIGINADSDQTEEAWEFIKWITSKKIQKEWVSMGAGGYIRRSTLEDEELLKEYPWQKQILESFETGDGDFRPRLPAQAELQDILGRHVNSVLSQGVAPRMALDQAQREFVSVLE